MRSPRAVKNLAFGLLTAALLLLLGNLAIEGIEHAGLIETHRPDDFVNYLDEGIFRRDGADIRSSAYAEKSMLPSRFASEKGDRWRMAMLGASFVMGTPYARQGQGEERPGGMASWLRAELGARFPDRALEILNFGAGAQGSYRVRRIAEQVLEHEPDLIFLATGNNEGPWQPDQLQEALHTLGGYRLLSRLIRPAPAPEDRPLYSPQLLPPDQVRRRFRENVSAILDDAAAKGVPVLLATLPINLRYRGLGAPKPMRLDERGVAVPGERPLPPCINAAVAVLDRGEPALALRQLGDCEQVAEATRWIGLAHYALGDMEAAREALRASVELAPRNRTRPSLNRIVRELAAAREDVYLVDLERRAEQLSPDGIPGLEIFLDFCHLDWRGYAAMSDVIQATLFSSGLGPERAEEGRREAVLDRDVQAIRWGLWAGRRRDP